ncbi:hypothetical protein BA896_021900 [Janthinobacterium lividum]|uniref:Uncharacterized protein n=1 Tax=Janthinobacterium lividum TaxID=29581 RepID=A0A1E8PKL0_9BURK|nr:hypothetical protein BA896_021900 [Janthinobacterium lividum]
MPKKGTRARRVMEVLFAYRQPLHEPVLMAAHGLDTLTPTIWRQGPYRSLAAAGLIEVTHARYWMLTVKGRALMDAAEAELMQTTTPAPAKENLVPPRSVPPFRPMAARPAIWLTREGALDFRAIPSLYSDRK